MEFEFYGKMFRQTRGPAMGMKMAPAYANLFLDKLETEFLGNSPYNLPSGTDS